MTDSYLTITEPSIAEYKDRGSKFLGYAYPIKTINKVEHLLEDLRAKHLKARHFCYAYNIGINGDEYRYNDDGEPSGTAGKPIYGQIKSFDLKDVFIVVVRYFGGTKLGASGLINAYKETARLALQNATIVERYISNIYELIFQYDCMGAIMNTLKSMNFSIIHKEFTQIGCVHIEIRKSESTQRISLLKAQLLGVSLEYIDETTEVSHCQIKYLRTDD